ncbi:MAG TPA: hypothetical protein VFT41_04505 [Gemmatimonadaceae bacterium]|nr:hypothetical protein [Gemmatimonadaceae bacterium]
MSDPSPARFVLGTHVYPASGAAGGRVNAALAGWRALGVELVNLQFADGVPLEYDGFRTVRGLTRDSNTVTGRAGTRKPVMQEVFDLLCREARAAGARYFGFSNADIIVSDAAIARVYAAGGDAHVFSRGESDPAAAPPGGIFVSGQDTFVVAVSFWERHRHRFRDYVIGEMPWDVIYTSILLSHGKAHLHNTEPLTRHVSHDVIWADSPFSDYRWYLARLDWTYFQRWYAYYNPVLARRETQGRIDAEWERDQLRLVFGAPISTVRRGFQGAKNLYYRARYRAAGRV